MMYQEHGSSNGFPLAGSQVYPGPLRRSMLPCIYEDHYLDRHVPDTHINLECDEIIDWDSLESCDIYTSIKSEKTPIGESFMQCEEEPLQMQQGSLFNMYDIDDFPPPNSPVSGIGTEENPVLFARSSYVTNLLQLWKDSTTSGEHNDANTGSCQSEFDESDIISGANHCVLSGSSSSQTEADSQGSYELFSPGTSSEMSTGNGNRSVDYSVCGMSLSQCNGNVQSLSVDQTTELQSEGPSMTTDISCPTVQLYHVSNSNTFQTINTVNNMNGPTLDRASPDVFQQELFPSSRTSSRSNSPSILERISNLASRYDQFRSLSPLIMHSPSPLSSRSSSPRFFRTPSPLDDIRQGLSGLPLDDYSGDSLVFYEDRYITRSYSPWHGSDQEVPDVDMEFEHAVSNSDAFPSLDVYYRERRHTTSCQDQVVPGDIEE